MNESLKKILDDNIKTFNGFSISSIKHPDVTLKDYHQELIGMMILVTANGFDNKNMMPSVGTIYKHFLENQSYLLIIRKDDEVIGFRSVRKVTEFNLLWLTGIVIREDCKKSGLAKFCLEESIRSTDCDIIACSTQSPVIYKLVRHISKKIYPDIDAIKETIPEKYQMMGISLMESRRGVFNKETFISSGLYPHCLYRNFPWVQEKEINDFFRNNLNFNDNGFTQDGFLLIGIL